MSQVFSIKEIIKDIEGLRDRDIPYIAIVSGNNLAFDTMKSINKDIAGKLSITKQKLINPVRIKKASKSNPYAKIFVDTGSWQHKVLKHHFFSGDRDRKGMEKALIRLGLMSSNEILTPPPGVKINPSTYVKMIAQLKLVYKSGYAANETKKSRSRKKRKSNERYFLINSYTRSHLHPGVYVRMPDHSKPICILRIVKAPSYKQRFKKFEDTVEDLYKSKREKHLSEAMDYVLRKNKSKGWT